MAAKPGTTDALASYLTGGYYHAQDEVPRRWSLGADGVLTVDLSGLADAGRSLARAALDAWEMVAGVEFREAAGPADIAFDDSAPGATTNATFNPATGEIASATIQVGAGWLDDHGATVGSYGFQTYLHEVGHALGIGHPGSYGGGATFADATWANDSWQQSVMSYLDQDENPKVLAGKAYVVTPMMADIVAAQHLYGAPEGGATAGNTTYGVGSSVGGFLAGVFGSGAGSLAENALTIFDEGGSDVLNLSDDGSAQVISLGQGTLSSVYGQVGNLAIARGTMIERAQGGSGSDLISGNSRANVLRGNGGDDDLVGGDGADSLYGGDGDDRLEAGDGDDALDGGAGEDALVGQAGADALAGGDLADRLDGCGGGDRLSGGGNRDTFVYSSGADVVTDFENDVDTLILDASLWGGGARTTDQLLDHAGYENGAVVFDFGHGNTLRLDGETSIGLLADDLAIG